jgi:tetratricopeptide (TPR) repeat protein
MQGQFGVARDLIADAKALSEEMGLSTMLAAGVLRSAGDIELLAGDFPAAERVLRAACEMLERMGDWGHFASVEPRFADALNAQGRGDEAAVSVELAAKWSLADDTDAQIAILRVRATLMAQKGDLDGGERLARQATELAAQTDCLNDHAKALTDLAGILQLALKGDQAGAAMQKALALYELKGNLVMVERTREWLTTSRTHD